MVSITIASLLSNYFLITDHSKPMSKISASIAFALVAVSLGACKPKAHDVAAPTAAPSAAPVNASADAAPKAAPAAAQAPVTADFDVTKVPMSTAVLPPFPYLNYPDPVNEGSQFTDKADFDEAYVLAGKTLRKVEGRVEAHKFSLRDANLSLVAARRNYENLVKAMGGVKVNAGQLRDLVPQYSDVSNDMEKKLRFYQSGMDYDCYLVRRPDQLIWIALMFTDSEVKTVVVAEEPFKQTVGYVTADTMKTTLASAGHIALYINFDTDKAGIRPDARPAVDEIAKLMDQDPALKLTIEGHTDNSGDAKHNKALSQQRADAVVGALMAAGIAKERMTAVGMGDTKPVADNKDDVGRAKNRRVELVKQA
jgi:OOP family OmpA-OmpF porin